MGKIAIANLVIYSIVCGLGIFIGLDLKKWYSWLLGIYGFFSGAIIGYLSESGTIDLQLGTLFAFVVLFGGAMVFSHRQRYSEKAAEGWLSQYGQDKRYSLLARFIRMLLKK